MRTYTNVEDYIALFPVACIYISATEVSQIINTFHNCQPGRKAQCLRSFSALLTESDMLENLLIPLVLY